jgi:chaperonin GroES
MGAALYIILTQEAYNMKFRPLHDRILVERIESEERTAGGIILPDSAKEKPQQGKIIAVGSGKRTEDGKVIPCELKAGDTILFGKYSGTEIKIEGVEYLIMREDDVLGLVES